MDVPLARKFLEDFGSSAVKVAASEQWPELGLTGTAIFRWTAMDAVNNDPTYLESISQLIRAVVGFLNMEQRGVASMIEQELLHPYQITQLISRSWVSRKSAFRDLFDTVQEISASEGRRTSINKDAAIAEGRLTLPSLDTDSEIHLDEPSDYPYSINDSLYDTLNHHLPCTCGQQSSAVLPSASNHSPKMCLQPREMETTGSILDFEFQMMISPNRDSQKTSDCEWRGIIFSCARKDESKKNVKTVSHSGDAQRVYVAPHNTAIEVVRQGEVSHGHISRLIQRQVGINNVQMTSGYHLGDILRQFQMKPWQRLFLAYTIARSVWLYYNSRWMSTVWTLEDFYFLQEKRNDVYGGVFCKPYLSVDFADTEVGTLEHRRRKQMQNVPTSSAFHRYPIVLGLGIMLLELGKGVSYRADRKLQWDDATINALYAKSISDFSKDSGPDEWMHGCDFPGYRKAVHSCLKAGLFDNAAFVENDPLKGLEVRRSILYTEVIHELEKLLKGTGYLEEAKSKLTLVPFKPGRSTHTWERPSSQLASTSQVERNESNSTTTNSVNGRVTAFRDTEAWFKSFDELSSILSIREKDRDGMAPKVKIGIIDTGVHSDVLQDVHRYKDFLNTACHCADDSPCIEDNDLDTEMTPPCDPYSHGSKSVRFVQRINTAAQIHVARTFDGEVAQEDTPSLVAKAIHHCVKEWQVDVIAMPLGFRKRYPEIEDAIQKANSKRVLIFSSPSNWGNTQDHSFPGYLCQTFKVMTMFATSPLCKPDVSWNPAPFRSGFNFAILGQNVQVSSMPGVYHGTSISTVIGAGFATRLIDFARHPDSRGEINAFELQGLEGMASVFWETVQKDRGYHCVRPWTLIRGGNIHNMDRDQKREAIRRIIITAIQQRHKIQR